MLLNRLYFGVTGSWLCRLGRSAWRNRDGSIAILAAITLSVLLGAVALALDLAQAYVGKATAQRIADESALAAAFAYANSSNSTNVAQSAAASLAKTNGVGGATVSTSIVTSPSGDGNKAALVTVTWPVMLSAFGQLATTSSKNVSGLLNLTVNAAAYAEIQQNLGPCILALGGSGIGSSGGGSVTANGCSVGSDSSVTGTGGTKLTAQAVYAVGAISPTGSSCNGGACISTSPTSGQTYPGFSAPVDPLADAGVFSRIPTVAAMLPPSFPSGLGSVGSGGSALTCSTGSSTLTVPAGVYGTISTSYYPVCSTIDFSGGDETTDIGGSGLSLTGSSVTLNFAAGTYNINGICVTGSTAVIINTSGTVVFNVWPSPSGTCTNGSYGISSGGSTTLTLNGPATYNVQGGINNGSSAAMVFTNGTGSGTSTFRVAGGINIASGGATFPSGTYSITSGTSSSGAGIAVATGTVTFGSGSFDIAGGITIGGSANLTIGGQLTSSSVFQLPTANTSGNALQTGGGSSFTIGNFPYYDINGAADIQGNLALGSGVYTVNGAFDAIAAGGTTITGTDVQIIAAGAISFGQGYNSITLSAPTTITAETQDSAGTVALASESSAASTVTAGASSTTITGAIYTPNAALTVSGAGNITGGGGCVEVFASGLTFSGSGSISTNCSALGSGSGGANVSVALVQ